MTTLQFQRQFLTRIGDIAPFRQLMDLVPDVAFFMKDHAGRDDHRQMRRVTLSIGVAAMPEHGETAGDLLQSAKAAVKEAKKEGRDRVRIAD